jgi:chromosome segregation ATPase
MEFDELLITTGVDALVRLVKEKERVELEDASAILNIPVETLEDWSRVLEEEGILRIEYRLTHIYLIWVRPTVEEIAQETKSFYEEKEGIAEEVSKVRERVAKQTEGVEDLQKSFTQFYAKAHKRIEAMEKTVAPLPAGKTISEGMFADYQKELGQMATELEVTKKDLEKLGKQIEGLGIEKETSRSKEIVDRMEAMTKEMREIEHEMERIRKLSKKGVPEDVKMPSVADIRKKFESVKKDFSGLRSRNARLREDMISLHESTEVLQNVAESIMGQEEKIQGLGKEVAAIAEETDALAKKVNEMDAKAKQNLEVVERLGESVTVAKNVLKKFPSQKKVMGELGELKKEEDRVLDKTKSLEKILEAAGGSQITAKQFAELTKRMDDRSKQMKRDLEALESALEHEKSTYLTFQKIKEKIVPSIDSYRKKLAAMDARVGEIKEQAAGEKASLQKDAKELQAKLKGGQLQGIMKVAEEIREKRKMLDEIKGSLDDLVSMSENLNKRVTLLSREARLLEIRAGKGAEAPVPEGKKEEIRHQLELSRDEEIEFRRKREELKKLIRRLWETES